MVNSWLTISAQAKDKFNVYNWPGGLTQDGWGFLSHIVPHWPWLHRGWDMCSVFIRTLIRGQGSERNKQPNTNKSPIVATRDFRFHGLGQLAPDTMAIAVLACLLSICIALRHARRHGYL